MGSKKTITIFGILLILILLGWFFGIKYAKNITQTGSNSQSFQNSKRDKSELDESIENQENEQVSKANDLSYLGMGRIIDIKR